jgi:DNA invertase Pin-like site-specific DNA recombinase
MNIVPTYDIYLRLSDLRIEEPFDKRRDKLIAFGDSNGWTLHRVIIENDMVRSPDGKLRPATAFKRKKITTPSGRRELRVIRQGFRDELLGDLESGRANAVIAEDLDRVVRDPRDLEDFIDVMQACNGNARSLSGSLTFTNGGTDAEIDMARMMVTMANKQSRDTARRVREGRERNWGESYQGGRRPFGYVPDTDSEHLKRKLLIVPDESALIVKWADEILNRGVSVKAILREIHQNGIPSASGGKWNGRTLKQVLTKPTVAGFAAHTSKIKDEATGQTRTVTTLKPAEAWDAILDEDTWKKLCEKLNNPPADLNRGNEPKNLLTGIATCGICNDGTTVRANGSGTLRGKKGYQCEKIAHIHRNIELVDQWVERNVTAYISRHGPDILKPEPIQDTNADDLRAEAKDIRKRQNEQIDLHGEGLIDKSQLQRKLREFKERLSVIDAQLAQVDKPDPLPEFRRHGPTRKIWYGLSLARKRAIIRMLVDIKILSIGRRGPGFDPDSVQITIKETGERLDVRQWIDTEKDQNS